MFSLIIENPQVLIFRHGTISCNLYFSAIYTHLRVLGPIHMNLIWSIPYLSRFPMFLWFSDVFWGIKRNIGKKWVDRCFAIYFERTTFHDRWRFLKVIYVQKGFLSTLSDTNVIDMVTEIKTLTLDLPFGKFVVSAA